MKTAPSRTLLDPTEAESNAFVDALLGFLSVSEHVDEVLLAAAPVQERDREIAPEEPCVVVDALLGVLSLKRTLDLLMTAVAAPEPQEVAPPVRSPTWGREVLR